MTSIETAWLLIKEFDKELGEEAAKVGFNRVLGNLMPFYERLAYSISSAIEEASRSGIAAGREIGGMQSVANANSSLQTVKNALENFRTELAANTEVARDYEAVYDLMPESPARNVVREFKSNFQNLKRPPKEELIRTMENLGGNKSAVARRYEVNPGTINKWLKKYGILKKDNEETDNA